MENQVKLRRSSGWQDAETAMLFSAVREASAQGRPLRSVFEHLSGDLGRKPNSIRNYYYACMRENGGSEARPAPVRPFAPEETHELLRRVLIARGEGKSVRSCVMEMAQGDRQAMLRYQNKYRTILRSRPELIEQVCQELRSEGLPAPASGMERSDAAFCEPDDASSARLMAEPCVADMLAGIRELMRRAARAEEADERLHQLDRQRVAHDLARIAWEKDFDEAVTLLKQLMGPVRELAALSGEQSGAQVEAFLAQMLPLMGSAEAFLTRLHA